MLKRLGLKIITMLKKSKFEFFVFRIYLNVSNCNQFSLGLMLILGNILEILAFVVDLPLSHLP